MLTDGSTFPFTVPLQTLWAGSLLTHYVTLVPPPPILTTKVDLFFFSEHFKCLNVPQFLDIHELLHLIGWFSLHPSDDVPVYRKVTGRLLQLLFSSLFSCWSVFGIRMLIWEVTPAIWLKPSVKVLLVGFKNTVQTIFVHLSGALQHQRPSEFKSYKYVRGYFQAILASLTVKWTQPWVRSGFLLLLLLKCRKWYHFSIILFIYIF